MQTPDLNAIAFYEKLHRLIRPDLKKLTDIQAASLTTGVVDSRQVKENIAVAKAGMILGDGDIEALVFLVMMAAAKSAQDDVTNIMAEVEAINKQKQQLRESLRKQAAANVAIHAAIKGSPSDITVSELSELQQLQLQMAMDRLSHIYTTISNIMKKIHDTEAAIIQNLK